LVPEVAAASRASGANAVTRPVSSAMPAATWSMLAVISSVRSSCPAVASIVACARAITASLFSRSPVTVADVWVISLDSLIST
jgi:hypothetical protein